MEGWEDIVLTVTGFVFLGALLPSVINAKTRISRRTSVPTAAAVWVQAATFFAVGLQFTALVTLGIALMWTHLAVYRAIPRPR